MQSETPEQLEHVEPFRVTEPGIYTMTEDQYHADPCPEPSLSSSLAWTICSVSPLHAKHASRRLNPGYVDEEHENLDVGTLAHQIVLEGSMARVRLVAGVTDWRTKAAQELRDKIRADGNVPLLAKTWDEVKAMTTATRAQLDAHVDGRHMFRNGSPEYVVIWKEGDVWCRARIDYLRLDGIDDYKSTRASANPETVARSMVTNGWSMQAVHYARGVEVLTGERRPFRFAVQECYAPYALAVLALGPEAQLLAEKQWIYALETWARCLESDVWPGYGARTAYASLAPWVESAWLDKEVRDGV